MKSKLMPYKALIQSIGSTCAREYWKLWKETTLENKVILKTLFLWRWQAFQLGNASGEERKRTFKLGAEVSRLQKVVHPL